MERILWRPWHLAFLFLLVVAACETPAQGLRPPHLLRTGAEVLADRDFDLLRGKRVGLITNHTAIVDSVHLVDLLAADDRFELAALFGPEHGLRGLAQGGNRVANSIDSASGIPIYSLYGTTRSPPDSVLATLDLLIFDIQDIGARFYTYISTMGRSMQAAARAGVPFLILDRPNPLGRRAEGFVLDSANYSFVGLYPIPITHGMTVGELALMIRGEHMLPGLDSLRLDVIPLSGWMPDSLWPTYESEWVKTSPNIPNFETALVYPGVALFEGTNWSEGRGSMTPFLHIGAPSVDAAAMADFLNARQIPGVRFDPDSFVPVSIPVMAESPKLMGVSIQGVRLIVTDQNRYRPVATGVELVSAAYRFTPEEARPEFFNSRWMRLISGGNRLESMIVSGKDPHVIIASWQEELAAFVDLRRKYLLY